MLKRWEKKMKATFVYVLELMLTLDKMQKQSVLYVKKRAEHVESYSMFSYCTLSSA